MKIAFLGTRGINEGYSGIETSIKDISMRLAKKGHSIIIYCRKPRKTKCPEQPFKNIRLVYIPTLHSKHLGTFIHTFLSTLHSLFFDADIVHFHALGPSLFSFLPRLFGKKTIVSVHGLDWKRKKWKFPARLFLKLCEYPAIYFPHKTIVVSRSLKKYFESKFKKEVYYIPNGIEVCFGDKEFNKKISKPEYVLFAGRLIPEKGIHYLIKAFNEIDTDKQLMIAGESSFTDEYVSYLRSISGARIKFLGFVERQMLRSLYESAYAFVLPSEVEGSPVSLLEAMSHGRCVLVSDIPECLEVIGDCGISFRMGDYLDLEEKLRYLIANPEFVNQTGLRAKKRISQQYAWEPIIEGLERVYSSLFSDKKWKK